MVRFYFKCAHVIKVLDRFKISTIQDLTFFQPAFTEMLKGKCTVHLAQSTMQPDNAVCVLYCFKVQLKVVPVK